MKAILKLYWVIWGALAFHYRLFECLATQGDGPAAIVISLLAAAYTWWYIEEEARTRRNSPAIERKNPET